MIEIKAPRKFSHLSGKKIFLAGSIEMGKATPWQQKVVDSYKKSDYIFLNPRRDNWDLSWKQTKDDPQFSRQVKWELKGQEIADLIVMYFDPKTNSPITLLELGLFGKSTPFKLLVCCEDGFYRKGNVDIVCERYGIKQVNSLIELIDEIPNMLT